MSATILSTFSTHPSQNVYGNERLDAGFQQEDRIHNPVAFHVTNMGDITWFYQALKQPDVSIFSQAVMKELNGHMYNKLYELIKHFGVSKNEVSNTSQAQLN